MGREFAIAPLSSTLKSYSLYSAVTWPSDGTVLACSYDSKGGLVIRSTDYGVTWTQVASIPNALNGLTSKTLTANGLTYYMAVDNSRRTYLSNGTGQTWGRVGDRSDMNLFSAVIGSNGMAFTAGANVVRRASYSTVFSTWTYLTIAPDPFFNLWFDVSTSDGVNVIIVGSDGMVYYSTTSGDSWTAGSSGTNSSIYCVSHATSSSVFAMAAGASGYLAKTLDGGSTWTIMTAFSTDYTAQYRSISVLSSTEAYVAAYSTIIDPKGVIYRTLNGGITWTLMSSLDSQLYSLAMYSSDYGVAGSTDGIGVYTQVAGAYNFVLSYVSFI
ncbi:hypothetical protein EON65_58495 [archaeon]|nr:MAG: hypothetical protein EON65_58495 [archaeon]